MLLNAFREGKDKLVRAKGDSILRKEACEQLLVVILSSEEGESYYIVYDHKLDIVSYIFISIKDVLYYIEFLGDEVHIEASSLLAEACSMDRWVLYFYMYVCICITTCCCMAR